MSVRSRAEVIETQLSSTPENVIIAGINERVTITHMTLTNTTSTAIPVVLYRLTSSSVVEDSGDNGNWIVKYTIPPYKAWTCRELIGHTIQNSQVISAEAGTASAVNLDASTAAEI